MDLKKIIIVCIALMILTPSFSFAFENDSFGSSPSSSPDDFSSFDSSPSGSGQAEMSDTLTDNSNNYDFSNLEETISDALLQEESPEELDYSDDMSMLAGISTESPSLSLSALTSA
ncbi:MAG: hypothetical protein FWE54_07225, partial [Methanimicrococcus sp.]|nr:hypothetical protein [Methanimicrococcus sp.]